jgi:hypothetical protein
MHHYKLNLAVPTYDDIELPLSPSQGPPFALLPGVLLPKARKDTDTSPPMWHFSWQSLHCPRDLCSVTCHDATPEGRALRLAVTWLLAVAVSWCFGLVSEIPRVSATDRPDRPLVHPLVQHGCEKWKAPFTVSRRLWQKCSRVLTAAVRQCAGWCLKAVPSADGCF